MILPPAPPYLSYDHLRAKADWCLREHAISSQPPVDVEHLVDCAFRLHIVPFPDLEERFGVDGFLFWDSVYVDAYTMVHNPNRYRFTLAHELGHHLLHQDLFRLSDLSPEPFIRHMLNLPRQQYARMEYQASCFGGLLLLPSSPLERLVQSATAAAVAEGIQVNRADPADRDYLAAWIAREAGVSEEVVLLRGKFDGHWEY